jgi:hypothetical protein
MPKSDTRKQSFSRPSGSVPEQATPRAVPLQYAEGNVSSIPDTRSLPDTLWLALLRGARA